MTWRRSLVLVGLVGCGPTPLSLVIDVGDVPNCVSNNCEDIRLGCDPYVSIRIFDPDQPKSPYVSICQPMQLDHNADLCSIANTQLPSNVTVPSQSLEVDVIIYPKKQLAIDMSTGDPLCPTDIQFEAVTGFPVEGIIPVADQAPNLPAIGGRAFYHPGESQTVVTLGCSYANFITPPETCAGAVVTAVTASAIDFENTRVSVDDTTADNLFLFVGEPTADGSSYTFDAKNPMLQRTSDDSPTWAAVVDKSFLSTACVQIIDQGTGETTPTLTCQAAPSTPGAPINVAAIRLAKASLGPILTAIGKSTFPDAGLVVGLVVDSNGQPKAGVSVAATDGTSHVLYLSADRKTLVTGMTSTSGIFVSEDAPYGSNAFTANDGTTLLSQPGGLVVGKVTAVLFQFN